MTFLHRRFGQKFNNTKREYGGRLYDSKLEVSYAESLDARLAAKQIVGWDRQRILRIFVNGRHAFDYKMDFIVETAPRCYELVETKGFPTQEWKLKWRVLECVFDSKEFRTMNRFSDDDELMLVLESSKANKQWAERVRSKIHGLPSPKRTFRKKPKQKA